MTTPFLERLDAVLRASDGVEYSLEEHAEDPSAAMAACETRFSEPTLAALRALACEHRGVHLHWSRERPGEPFAVGEFNVFHPAVALANNDASVLPTGPLPEDPDFLAYVDNHPVRLPEDCYTLIGPSESSGALALGYCSGGATSVLALDWAAYQDWAAETLGYFHWQCYFAAEKTAEEREYLRRRHLPAMLRDLAACFPRKDLARVRSLESLL